MATTRMPSRTHSCSELQKASERMVAVKKEAETEEELQKKIEEILLGFWLSIFLYYFSSALFETKAIL